MKLFGRDRKRITRRRPRSLEDQWRQLADRTLLSNMRNNPKVLREWIKKEYGIDIPDKDDIDVAIDELMSKTEKELMGKALEGAEDDEQLQGVAREAFMTRLLKIVPGRGGRMPHAGFLLLLA